MTDRYVRKISPSPEGIEEQRPRPFSAFAEQRNLVLLGDPGAGKSHLFRKSAAAVGGRFVTARRFLNIPTVPADAVLFIDGLDERRAGRGDRGTIDAIVQKLFEVAPAKVRMSCRVADWLGESDLVAFEPYFDLGGGAVVLGLERLSADEQRVVLMAQGMDKVEADTFMREAESRGLADFLENPQNLIMLVEAVKTGSWPATRSDLFELSTRLLLSEPNREHSRTGGGVYGVDELRQTAGAICAARLISDVAGISLREHEGDADIPSYRTFDFLDLAKVQAALGRRVFEAGPFAESVDYAHRTTAEFLGAAWLASTVRAGLPLGRVQALMGVDGHPAPELRGLHAWLAVVLPEHADQLIEADPYGVLTYGDAGSLTPSSRHHLLDTLGRLSQTGPWFRSGRWQSPAIGALSKPDMVDAFRAVLDSPTAGFGLRSVVVDALAMGTSLPAMKDDLANVLTRRASPFAERLHALAALLRLGPDGKALVVQAYRERLGQDDSSLRLRSEIIARLYGHDFGPVDVARLMGDTLTAETEVTTGALWSISSSVPVGDIPAVLDRFEPIEREERSDLERRNVWEVASTFERLLLRVLQEARPEPDEGAVWRWLRVRASFRDTYGGARTGALRETLRQKPELLRGLAENFFHTVVADSNRWLAYSEFREATAHAIEWEQLLEWVVAYLPRAECGSERKEFLYELALNLTFGASARAQEIFAELYAWGDARTDLRPIRDAMMSCTLPLGLFERWARNAAQEEETEGAESRRRNFEANAAAIRSGAHLGWLAWAARVYFALFSDLDENATPRERLIEVLGEANTDIVIEGFIATLQRPDFPTLENVAAMSANHQIYDRWYALIAGLDERWCRIPGLDGLSDDLLRAALAIEQANPTFIRGKTTSERRPHDWKTTVLQERAELARDAYLALARAMLRKGEQHVEGLRELLNDEPFAPFRSEVTLHLLGEFPNATPFRLDELLRSGLGLPAAHSELLACAREVLAGSGAIDLHQRDLWLASAYFLSPREFEAQVEREAQQRLGLTFHLRDLSGYERHGDGQQPLGLWVSQLEFLARVTGSLFPEAPFPSDGWSGDTNPWDASEFVRYLVNALSAVPTEAATAALVQLDNDHRLASYQPHIRHALANQRARRREAEYDRPDWLRTLRALNNGPPANVPDLHALLVAHLQDLKQRIASTNTDTYKWFWNEDGYGRTTTPKPEESCRDVLVGLLRPALLPLGITIEPEGHMVADKRSDISVAMPGRKILCELKRDYHAEVWRAAEEQLDRFYTIDPEAKGFGVYGVFWFGDARPSAAPTPPHGWPQPQSAVEMEQRLCELIQREKQHRLAVVVFDVSGVR
jgi:hypothetical protein